MQVLLVRSVPFLCYFDSYQNIDNAHGYLAKEFILNKLNI